MERKKSGKYKKKIILEVLNYFLECEIPYCVSPQDSLVNVYASLRLQY